MPRFRSILILLQGVGLLLFTGCFGLSQKHDSYVSDALPPDTVLLDNGVIRFGVSPMLGRVVHFGLVEGRNLIWLNPEMIQAYLRDLGKSPDDRKKYYNVGGDKVWPTVQTYWENATGNLLWPPDEHLDGSPWRLIERTQYALTIESIVSPNYGLVVQRRFQMSPVEAEVTITNTFRRVAPNQFPLSVWTVTQVERPKFTLLDIAEDRPLNSDLVRTLGNDSQVREVGDWRSLNDALIVWNHQDEENVKLATFGRWLAAIYDEVIFLQETEFDSDGYYPDASSLHVFYPPSDFTELEMLGPEVRLKVGETLQNTITWKLLEWPVSRAVESLLQYDSQI